VHFVRSQRRPWVNTTVPLFQQLVNEVDIAARPPSLVPTNVWLWLQTIRPKHVTSPERQRLGVRTGAEVSTRLREIALLISSKNGSLTDEPI